MAKSEPKSTAVAAPPQNSSNVPAHLQKNRSEKASIGNVDRSDLIVPRVKLLQAISPEVADFEAAENGVFWHTVAEQSLGPVLRVVPIVFTKSVALWAPRGDDRGILARSKDCIHWDEGYANMEYTVKVKGNPNPVTYKTMGTVAESRLADFGSSVPGDPQSAPAASLTYNFMFYLMDYPDLSPAVVINTRSSLKAGKSLLSKIDLKPVDPFGQVYNMKSIDDGTAQEPFKNYAYESAGYVEDEALYNDLKALYERWKEADWKANEENDEAASSSAPGDGSKPGGASSKF